MSSLNYKHKKSLDILGLHTPADQLDQEVQGILWILHLLSGQTDLAVLWGQAHHQHPEKMTIRRHKR